MEIRLIGRQECRSEQPTLNNSKGPDLKHFLPRCYIPSVVSIRLFSNCSSENLENTELHLKRKQHQNTTTQRSPLLTIFGDLEFFVFTFTLSYDYGQHHATIMNSLAWGWEERALLAAAGALDWLRPSPVTYQALSFWVCCLTSLSLRVLTCKLL